MKKFFCAIVIVLMAMSFAGNSFAKEPVIYQRTEQAGMVEVSTGNYDFDIIKYGRSWTLTGYNQNADPLSIFNSIKQNSIEFWYDTKALSKLITDGEIIVTYNKQTVSMIADVIKEALDNISAPIDYQWNNSVSSTAVVAGIKAEVAKLTDEVATNKRFIDALWIEEHGFNKVTVRVHVNKANKSIKIYDLDHKLIPAYFIVRDGDMGELQTKRVAKLTALSWNARYGEFGILHSADIYSGDPIKTSPLTDIREVNLFVTHKHLTKTGVKKVLGSAAFGITSTEINEMLQ